MPEPDRHPPARPESRTGAGFRRVRLSQAVGGWRAEIEGLEPLLAASVAELGHLVRGRVGDQAWSWRCDLGQDTDWYVDLVRHSHAELGNAVLSNAEASGHVEQAVWALRLGVASVEDCAEVLGIPVDWVRRVWHRVED